MDKAIFILKRKMKEERHKLNKMENLDWKARRILKDYEEYRKAIHVLQNFTMEKMLDELSERKQSVSLVM